MTAAELVASLASRLDGVKLVVVANREPYIHELDVRKPRGWWDRLRGRPASSTLRWTRPASGLVTALDPVMRACGGTWVAHGSGSGDRAASDAAGRVAVPPDAPSYTLRRVWLSPEEEEGYYYGFSNNALWPLCHIAYARPVFNEADWQHYAAVNRRFADTVLEEIAGTRAIVFVQDYHYALLPRMIKDARPDAVVCQFWHIPWPNPEAFRICPWQEAVLDGLLGNDLLGFHIQYHCNNFVETVDRTLEARLDAETFTVHRRGHKTAVKPFPISIDPGLWATEATGRAWASEVAATRRSLGLRDERLLMGVDRLDYTKGIPERLRALDRLLESRPEWRKRVVLLQIGAPSRDHLDRYQSLSDEVDHLVAAINERHGASSWRPVIYRRQHHEAEDIAALYRASDALVVSSVHDGMNLVAKEFVAARGDERGVLLLSRFTGAARSMAEAVQVNPFATDEFAEALHDALMMPADEQARRMRSLRSRVHGHTVFDWAEKMLTAACRIGETGR
ncbi:MAG: trehalose-6-phosphate synthase [Vicinamibacterales bacterium]|nr:trehalose-6-phosphate synthase [Vicinamibacterales bacterium]